MAAGLRGLAARPERVGAADRRDCQPHPGPECQEARLQTQRELLHKLEHDYKEHEQQRQGLVTSRATCLGARRLPWSRAAGSSVAAAAGQRAGDDAGAARALRERQTELKTRLSHLEQEKQVSSRRRREVLGRWAAHASSLGIAEYDLRRLLAMSPDELKGRRAALQALEDAAPRRVPV